MVANTVQVLGAMGEHLVVDGVEVHQPVEPVRTVQQVKASRHRIADPVVSGRAAHHGAFAAGPQALDNLVDRVVVRRLGILVHVHARKALHARDEFLVVGVGQGQKHESAHSFAGMEKVGLRDEVLVVRAVFGKLGERGTQLFVLFKVALVGALIVPEHGIRGAHGVEERPIVEGFDRVVGTVESSPSRRVKQITADVEVAVREPVHGKRVGAQQFALEHRPFRRRHGLVDDDTYLC